MAEVRELAREHKPKIIVVGASAYPRTLRLRPVRGDRRRGRRGADGRHGPHRRARRGRPPPEPGAVLATIVTTTTHKTLRGPRGGMILCRETLAKAINSQIFPGIQGGPLDARHRRQGGRLRRGAAARLQGLPAAHRRQRAGARRGPEARRACASSPAAPTTTCMLVDLRPKKLTGKVAEEALGQGRDHRQQEHDPVRPREADRRPAASASARPRSPRAGWARRDDARRGLIDRALDAPPTTGAAREGPRRGEGSACATSRCTRTGSSGGDPARHALPVLRTPRGPGRRLARGAGGRRPRGAAGSASACGASLHDVRADRGRPPAGREEGRPARGVRRARRSSRASRPRARSGPSRRSRSRRSCPASSARLQELGEREIRSAVIGEAVMQRLRSSTRSPTCASPRCTARSATSASS